MTGIEIQNLRREFGDVVAVEDVSLQVLQGEALALLGVNGAGKSTMLRILSGLCLPTRGDARLLGYSIVQNPAQAKRHLAVVPQEPAIAANLTVQENLQFMAEIYGIREKEAQQRVQKMLRTFQLDSVRARRAGKLSGGWQRRLSIAMALVSEPKILLLDEPTLGLDILARRELWKLIQSLHGSVTMILTTHDLEEAAALCDRIAIMSHGRLRALGTEQQLLQQTGAATFSDAFVQLAGEETV